MDKPQANDGCARDKRERDLSASSLNPIQLSNEKDPQTTPLFVCESVCCFSFFYQVLYSFMDVYVL